MATPSNIPVQSSSSVMATEQYVRRKPYAKKPYSKKTPKKQRYMKYAVNKNYAPHARAPPKIALKVSDCAMRYMATVCNPFEAEPGACVPCDLFPLPSQKIRAFTRGTFALGTTGYGFIIVNPVASSDAATGACQFTTAASVGGSGTAVSVFTGLGAATIGQLPYTNAQLTSVGSVQCRVVACGVRVRYAGTESGRSGTIVAYEDQDHATLASATYLSTSVQPSSVAVRPSGDGTWDATVCSSGPTTPQELEFSSLSYPNTTIQNSGNGYMIIFISGVAGDSYNFEIFEHLEYIGQAVAAKTPSHADTDQYGKIVQSAKEISAVQPITPAAGPSLWERFANKVANSIPQLISAGSGLLRGLAGDATGYAQLIGAGASMIAGESNVPPPPPRISYQEYNSNRRLTRTQQAIMA